MLRGNQLQIMLPKPSTPVLPVFIYTLCKSQTDTKDPSCALRAPYNAFLFRNTLSSILRDGWWQESQACLCTISSDRISNTSCTHLLSIPLPRRHKLCNRDYHKFHMLHHRGAHRRDISGRGRTCHPALSLPSRIRQMKQEFWLSAYLH